MSAALDERASSTRAETGDEASPTAPDEVGSRGTLHIADKVVEKIASKAVTEIDLATGAPRTVLGLQLGSADGDHDARANAHVDGQLVTVVVTLAVRWPAPVRTVCEQVRKHVRERISTLTGLEVAEVDCDVPTLITGRKPNPRVR